MRFYGASYHDFVSFLSLIQANYFDRWDVALPGFAKFFKKSGNEEKVHAEILMTFQTKRGGRVLLQDIRKPAKDDWVGPLEAMQAALQLERDVNQALLDLHKIADRHGDGQVLYPYRSYFSRDIIFANFADSEQENNTMLMEEEYRRRLHEVTNEVKKRLNYHVSSNVTSLTHCAPTPSLIKTCPPPG